MEQSEEAAEGPPSRVFILGAWAGALGAVPGDEDAGVEELLGKGQARLQDLVTPAEARGGTRGEWGIRTDVVACKGLEVAGCVS